MISWKNITKARCLENSFFLKQKQKKARLDGRIYFVFKNNFLLLFYEFNL